VIEVMVADITTLDVSRRKARRGRSEWCTWWCTWLESTGTDRITRARSSAGSGAKEGYDVTELSFIRRCSQVWSQVPT